MVIDTWEYARSIVEKELYRHLSNSPVMTRHYTFTQLYIIYLKLQLYLQRKLHHQLAFSSSLGMVLVLSEQLPCLAPRQ